MSPTHTRRSGRLCRYYVSQAVLKNGPAACPIGSVPTGDIEAAVIGQVRALLRQPQIIVATWRGARAQKPQITEASVRDALHQFDGVWGELLPAEQARIVRLLVERVDVRINGPGDQTLRRRG